MNQLTINDINYHLKKQLKLFQITASPEEHEP